MTNKLTLTKGKITLYLLLFCIFLAQSCRKDVLRPNADVLQSGISIAEARQYFEKNIAQIKPDKPSSTGAPAKGTADNLIDNKQPMWDAAILRGLSMGTNAVLIPLHRPDTYVNISNKHMVKYGFLNYMMMRKDEQGNMVTEWVELKPTERWIASKVSRKYEGRILVRDWNGKIKRVIDYGLEPSSKTPSVNLKPKGKLMSTGTGEIVCSSNTSYTVTSGRSTCSCQGHTYEQWAAGQCICGDIPKKGYTTTIEHETTFDCFEIEDDDPNGTGGTRPSGTGNSTSSPTGNTNGGTTGPSDYVPLNCDSDPDYVVPTIPPPPGQDYLLPCSVTEIPVTDVPDPNQTAEPLTKAVLLIHYYNTDPDMSMHLSADEVAFLNSHTNIAEELSVYLKAETPENKAFGKWAIEYLTLYPDTYPSFQNVFLSGPHDLIFENVQIENIPGHVLSASDYNFTGISNYFTEAEFDNIIENLSNDITEDPIQLYMIACYKNSKLLNSSIYSKPNNFQIGEYSLCPHYNSQNRLVFYSAFRKASLGIEYLIKADALNAFKEKYSVYKAAADLFYVNGKPSYSQLQMAAGDYWAGIVEAHKEAYSNPMYYLYLAHVFTATATNLKTVPNTNQPIKFTSSTIRNTKQVSITIENMSIAEYRNAIGQKYNTTWQPLGDGKFRLEVGQNRYMSYPFATSTREPTIEYFRNGNSIGKFRFHN